jgi:EPS-associated MarR family transcriptional regulator
MNKDQIQFDLLRKLEGNPEYTQRQLSQEMGISLGKVNYCINKLVVKGLVKLSNFSSNPNKVGYLYLLTPKGIDEKTRLTFTFLKIKVDEYEALKKEINLLKKDTERIDDNKIL